MLHETLTEAIIRCIYDVHDEMGLGFLESIYEASLCIALQARGLRAMRQVAVEARFRGVLVGEFRADVIVEDTVLVELKAARALHPVHEAQVINYLRASRLEVGLLVNFGAELTFRRIILTRDRKQRARNVRVGPRSGPP